MFYANNFWIALNYSIFIHANYWWSMQHILCLRWRCRKRAVTADVLLFLVSSYSVFPLKSAFTFLLSGTKRDRLETLTRRSECSQFAVDYFFSVTSPKAMKLKPFTIMQDHTARNGLHTNITSALRAAIHTHFSTQTVSIAQESSFDITVISKILSRHSHSATSTVQLTVSVGR